VKKLGAFVVDTDGWGHADMVTACRLVLRATQLDAKRCETDIPADRRDWPPDVVAAADTLRHVAARTGRIDRYGYAETGIIEVALDEVWSAFVAFVPWAYDATVWNADAADIVSLADEGQSIVARVTPEQYGAIVAELGDRRLVPEHEWRRVR
jgi:hypothetical protein